MNETANEVFKQSVEAFGVVHKQSMPNVVHYFQARSRDALVHILTDVAARALRRHNDQCLASAGRKSDTTNPNQIAIAEFVGVLSMASVSCFKYSSGRGLLNM
jgi:hypothetical protein